MNNQYEQRRRQRNSQAVSASQTSASESNHKEDNDVSSGVSGDEGASTPQRTPEQTNITQFFNNQSQFTRESVILEESQDAVLTIEGTNAVQDLSDLLPKDSSATQAKGERPERKRSIQERRGLQNFAVPITVPKERNALPAPR